MKCFITLLIFFISTTARGQLQPIQHSDYDDWKRISNIRMSDNGHWLAVQTDPQEGDPILKLIDLGSDSTTRYERAVDPMFTSDNDWLIYTAKPAWAEVRRLKLKDTKKKDMPHDHLVRVNLRSGISDTVHNVSGFSMPEARGAYLAVILEDEKEEEPVEDTTGVEEEQGDQAFDSKKENKKGDGYFDKEAKRLLIWDLTTGYRDTLERITEYRWARNVSYLAGVQSAGDSTQHAIFWRWNPERIGGVKVLHTGFEGIGQFALSDDGSRVAWLATADTAKADIRYYDLHEDAETAEGGTALLLSSRAAELPDGWMISPKRSLNYAADGRSLYLGTVPVPEVFKEDTTVLDEEKVSLDIWSWHDGYIQPMQEKRANREKDRSYLGRYDIQDQRFVQLAGENLPEVSVDFDHPTQWLSAYDDRDYRITMSWDVSARRDAYVVDAQTGERKLIEKGLRGHARMSPAGRYLYWYSPDKRNWQAVRLSDGQRLILSANIPYPVWNEEHDQPGQPGSYGSAGWTANDSSFVVYDAFDLWEVVPGGETNCLSAGRGRRENTRMRYISLDSDEQFLPTPYLKVHLFDESDKSSGYGELDVRDGDLEILIYGDYRFSRLAKADSAEVYWYRRESVELYPEIYAVQGDDLAKGRQVTHTNPQQDEFRWSTAELVRWTSPKGIELEGLLYKPEDFDPQKKYPVLIYFYEQYSDLLHRYWAPAPSASVINFPYFLSREYIIFIPDIHYETGYPGASAEECVLSGARMIAREPWADASRIAIQGQSWGGYQVAHLVTRSNMFRCAMAGAPVSNMTSAYGGIRWGSGMSREFQYEQTQSRIGGTLWEQRDLYIENSPLFYSDRVETPLLIMHNDGDGAVPWYQGIEMFMALRRLQKPVWMLVYNNEEHNLMKRHNRKDLSIRMGQFFDHYLKDAPPPEWMVLGRTYIEKETNPRTGLIEE